MKKKYIFPFQIGISRGFSWWFFSNWIGPQLPLCSTIPPILREIRYYIEKVILRYSARIHALSRLESAVRCPLPSFYLTILALITACDLPPAQLPGQIHASLLSRSFFEQECRAVAKWSIYTSRSVICLGTLPPLRSFICGHSKNAPPMLRRTRENVDETRRKNNAPPSSSSHSGSPHSGRNRYVLCSIAGGHSLNMCRFSSCGQGIREVRKKRRIQDDLQYSAERWKPGCMIPRPGSLWPRERVHST